MTESTGERNPIDVLADEFLDRYRRGERPPLNEYTDQHPELADEIRELFPLLQEMESARSDGESRSGANDDTENGATALPPLRELGDYRILREVGRGGMGIVYEAEQISLSRRVALKVLPQQMLLNENHQRRFEREARSAGKLHHTNIVPVFGVGQADGYHFYVMQFIQGLGLDEVVDEVRRMSAPGSDGSSTPAAGSLRVVERRDVSAADVAQSLVTGQFDRTKMTDESGDATLVSALREEAAPEQADESSTSQSSSGSLAVSSSASMPGGSESHAGSRGQHTYWLSVAHIGQQVAEALDYAHKQGVLHRDVKPSNLLLDLRGTVWVTDFGLAKANDQKDLTHTGDILGTIRYIPPESFEGTTDVRGDVYSLGLTLYELLALRPAFDEQERHKLIKQVTTSVPERLEKLNPQIPRDLVTIVHKAIDRDPEHRYQTPQEMAEDLERFGHDEPIRARRSTAWDRVRKWARRNPALAAASAAVVFLLITVTVVSVVAYRQTAAALVLAQQSAQEAKDNAELAQQNEQAAQKNAEEAQQQRNLAREVVDKMFTQVAEDWMANNASLEPLQEQFLQDALDFYTQLSQEKTNDPEVLLETGNAYRRIGEIQFKLAKNAEAEQAFLAGAEMLKQLVEEHPEEPIYREALAAIYHEYGYMCQFLAQRHAAAREAYRQAYHHRNVLAESYPDVAEHRRNAALSLGGLANGGAVDDRVQAYKQSLEILATVPEELLQDPLCRFRIGLIYSELGQCLRWQQHHDEGWTCFDKGKSIYRQLVEDFPQSPVYRNELAWALREESAERFGGDLDKKEQTIRQAVEIEKRLVEESAKVPDYQFVLAFCYRQLGWTLHERGKVDEAQSSFRASIDVFRKLIKENPDFRSGYFAIEFDSSIRGLIDVLGAHITPQDEESLLRESTEVCVKAFRNHPDSFGNAKQILTVCSAQRDLASARFEMGDITGGVERLEDAKTFIDARIAEDPDNAEYRTWKHELFGLVSRRLHGYAQKLKTENERDQAHRLDQTAEDYHRRQLESLREHYGDEHMLVASAIIERSLVLVPADPSESGRAKVIELCGRWEPVYRKHHRESLSNLSDFNAGQKQAGDQHQLGMALRGAGFVAESIPFFQRVLELRRRLQAQIPNPNKWQKLEVFHSIRYLAEVHFEAQLWERSAELMREGLTEVDMWVRKEPQEEHFHHWKTLQIRDADRHLRRYAEELKKAGNEELARKVEQASEDAYTQQLSALRERFGDEHTLVALALVCTAERLDYQRRHAEAVELFGEAVRIRRTVLGPEHADVGHALIRLGWNENAQGRIEPAVAAFREALAVFHKAYAKDSPHTAYVLYHLAGFMHRQQEHAEAEELYREALSMKRRVLGENHLDVGDCLRGVAFVRFELGDIAGAIEMLHAAKAFIDARIAEHPHEQRYQRWKADFSRHSEVRLCDLAHKLAWKTDFSTAQQLFREGLQFFTDSDRVDPGAHWHWYRYAVLCAHLGDAGEHGRISHEMVKLFADASEPEIIERIAKSTLLLPGSVDAAEMAARLEKFADAAQTKDFILAWYPLAQGMAEYRSGRFAESLERLQASRAASNGSAVIDSICRFFEAMALHRLGRPSDAQSSYEAGFELLDAHIPSLDSGDLGGGWNDILVCHTAQREAETLLKTRDTDEYLAKVQAALEQQKQRAEESPAALELQSQLGLSYRELGFLLQSRGDNSAAAQNIRESIEVFKKLVAQQPEPLPMAHAKELHAAVQLLLDIPEQGIEPAQQESLLHQVIDTYRRVLATDAASKPSDEEAAVIDEAHDALIGLRLDLGDMAGGIEVLNSALEFVNAQLAEEPNSQVHQQRRTVLEGQLTRQFPQLAVRSLREGNAADAETIVEGLNAYFKETGNREPMLLNQASWFVTRERRQPTAAYKQALAWARRAIEAAPNNGAIMNTLGVAQYRAGEFAAAAETLSASGELNARGTGVFTTADIAFLAMAHHQLGNAEQARQHLEQLRFMLELNRWKKDAESQSFLQEAEQVTCALAVAEDALDEKVASLRQLLEQSPTQSNNEQPERADLQFDLGNLLSRREDYRDAEEHLRGALDIRRRLLGDDHGQVGDCLRALALLHGYKDDQPAKEQFAREALAICRKQGDSAVSRVAEMLTHVIASLHAQGKQAETVPLYTERIELLRRLHGESHPQVAGDARMLAKLLTAAGDVDAARQRLDQAIDIINDRLRSNAPQRTGQFIPLDLQPSANQPLTATDGIGVDLRGNDFRALPRGEQTFAGVGFHVGDKLIQLGSQKVPDMPEKIEGIVVGRTAGKLHILHGTQYGSRWGRIGAYRVLYADGSSETIPIAVGRQLRDWWHLPEGGWMPSDVAWVGANEASRKHANCIHLSIVTWNNPHPQREIASITFRSANKGAAPFCVAMTVELPKSVSPPNDDRQEADVAER